MATSGKLTIGKRRLIATPAPVLFGDMRFEFLPPLPIISKSFGFLTCVNLSSVGWVWLNLGLKVPLDRRGPNRGC